jgi:hypothetical protein
MSRDLNLLVDEFKIHADFILAALRGEGHNVRPFFTLRDPWTQAKLWRQSRSFTEVRKIMGKLRQEGAPFLAQTFEDVGAQWGRWATNALPGQSWHQWGEAMDVFVTNDAGRAVWSAKHPAYLRYAELAREQGLTAGFFWQRRDAVHIQLSNQAVRAAHTWPQINETMEERFGPDKEKYLG